MLVGTRPVGVWGGPGAAAKGGRCLPSECHGYHTTHDSVKGYWLAPPPKGGRRGSLSEGVGVFQEG